MRHRLKILAAAAAAAFAAALLSFGPAQAEPGAIPDAPDKLPKAARGDRTKNLDFLFGALKAAPDEASAKHVEARIWAIWLQTPSDTAALLMSRAKAAISDVSDHRRTTRRSAAAQRTSRPTDAACLVQDAVAAFREAAIGRVKCRQFRFQVLVDQ